MTLEEIIQEAKRKSPKCRACPVCNGLACKGEIPGLGGKGSGSTFIRNVEKLKSVRIQMDVLVENKEIDTTSTLFGHTVSLPVYCAPVAGIKNNYGAEMTEEEYNKATVEGCLEAGTLAFTGDGIDIDTLFAKPLQAVLDHDGMGIPTIKPWCEEGVQARIERFKGHKVFALATDVDAAGLVLLRKGTTPVVNKSVADLKKMKEMAGGIPLIVKGVLTVEGARKCVEAGADAIVVSNHGGRVLDDALSTIEVLPEIAAAVKGQITILVDGGFRTGLDVFKALALGADGVLIGRPLALAAVGGGKEGVRLTLDKIRSELRETMIMSGCSTVAEITRSHVHVDYESILNTFHKRL